MEKFIVKGGNSLFGEISISGAKNSAVAILPATVLAGDVVELENVPQIRDVDLILSILEEMGAVVERTSKTSVRIDTTNVTCQTIPYELAKQFRASYYFLGIMLSKFHHAEVAMPGGDNFGERPIDLHIRAFEQLGATVTVPADDDECGTIVANAVELNGANINFIKHISVGATINTMLAAVLAEGDTIILNPAKEPHVVDLANFLNRMGADIFGAGTDKIRIRGVKELHGCHYTIVPDQIQAGTYMVAAAACGGEVRIKGVIPHHLNSIITEIEEAGAAVSLVGEGDTIVVTRYKPLTCSHIRTMAHPGFPTDMHPQIATLLSIANGTSTIEETIWDNRRFKYVNELNKMGACITVDGDTATIEGVTKLHGAKVEAVDLRAGAAMVIAGLVADGETVVNDVECVDRGYEEIVEKLQSLGADIQRISE